MIHAPAHHPSLSDDAYAVLLDVARQPRSILLATTPKAATRELLDPPPALSPSATRLTSAERHLLAHHRDEVARWLQLTIARLLVERADMPPLYSQQESGSWADVPQVPQLVQYGGALLETNPNGTGPIVPHGLRALRRETPSLASISDLVAVSASFRADPFHRLVSASIWMAQGYSASAARACLDILTIPCSTAVAHAAYSRLGSVAAIDGRWTDAEAAYSRAFELRAIECTALCALRSALQAGDQSAVSGWLDRLRVEGPGPQALGMMSQGIERTTEVGASHWTTQADRLARALSSAPWIQQWVCGGAA